MGRREAEHDGHDWPHRADQEQAERRARTQRLRHHGCRCRRLGAGVYDRLVELGHSVGEIRGGLPAIKPEDFVNRRSEWYWNLRKRFEDGEIDIDPLDKALAQQLVKIKWSMTSKGQIAVETKKEMRARGLPSPDRADAVAYAFAHVDLPTVDVEAHQGESITGDLMQKAW
jgi:hypothetical protein